MKEKLHFHNFWEFKGVSLKITASYNLVPQQTEWVDLCYHLLQVILLNWLIIEAQNLSELFRFCLFGCSM